METIDNLKNLDINLQNIKNKLGNIQLSSTKLLNVSALNVCYIQCKDWMIQSDSENNLVINGDNITTSQNIICGGNLTVSGDLTAPNIYTKLEVDDKLNGYSDNKHTHNQIDNDLTVSGVINVSNSEEFKANFIGGENEYNCIRVGGTMSDYALIGHAHTAKEEYAYLKIDSGNCEVNVHGNKTIVKGPLSVSGDITIGSNQGLVLQNNGYSGRIYLASNGKSLYFYIGGDHKYLWRDGSQTIIHHTNVQGEIGTFCESTGAIYDGYESIDETDCICAVQQSSTLNPKIVGIITSDTEFASHGDVLVKIAPGTVVEIGDILCPDENGYGRKAMDEEKMFMLLNSIPMPKITSLNTGIENIVATFLF